ncbi:MAG: AMP-binding protein [Spirochaetia bacterium]|jgi:long-chain acyl-CoA synthetase
MQVNWVTDPRNVHSIRGMVECFRGDRLSCPALKMKKGDGYWTLTYGEMRDHVRNLGAALLSRGLRKGNRVGLISENRSEWVITYLAVTCAAVYKIPHSFDVSKEELPKTSMHKVKRFMFAGAGR